MLSVWNEVPRAALGEARFLLAWPAGRQIQVRGEVRATYFVWTGAQGGSFARQRCAHRGMPGSWGSSPPVRPHGGRLVIWSGAPVGVERAVQAHHCHLVPRQEALGQASACAALLWLPRTCHRTMPFHRWRNRLPVWGSGAQTPRPGVPGPSPASCCSSRAGFQAGVYRVVSSWWSRNQGGPWKSSELSQDLGSGPGSAVCPCGLPVRQFP